ncbi:CopG family ribbon-helix-helix protein [Marinospirillum sp.]|uniref:CopG family ribbon-helix-helix protein n=1 Tax=Marinospirillum sp. TaxID=2183934 RepID=UPI00384D4759
MPQAETRVLTAHVPLSLADKVDLIAERLERPRSWVMKQALAAWIDQEEERYQMTLEGIACAKAGQVVSHQAVQEWAQSLSTDNPLPLPKVAND